MMRTPTKSAALPPIMESNEAAEPRLMELVSVVGSSPSNTSCGGRSLTESPNSYDRDDRVPTHLISCLGKRRKQPAVIVARPVGSNRSGGPDRPSLVQ